MHAILNRPGRVPRIAAAIFLLVAFANAAPADNFQWEYINPADPSQGKRQSTVRTPGGAGVNAVAGAYLAGRDLTLAYMIGANLTNANLGSKIEVQGSGWVTLPWVSYSGPYDFINFRDAKLTNADFTGADVRGTSFSRGYCPPGTVCTHNATGYGIFLAQLYSTASYQAHDLRGIDLTGNGLSGGNFAGQNLTNANFTVADLTDADFTGAEVRGAGFSAILGGTGITLAQLYSTTSYRAHDLSGVGLQGNHLEDGNFAGLNLTNVRFVGATLTGTDFAGTVVQGANFNVYGYSAFGVTYGVGTGITLTQLYSTASYQAHELSGIGLAGNNLEGGNFVGQNLTNSVLGKLTGADLTAADARGAYVDVSASGSSTDLIRPDGHISGLDLDVDGLLVVRDYDGQPYNPALRIPITVDQHVVIGPGGTLRMVFEADAWDSAISFAPGIPVTLGGTLELTFAHDVNLASQLGRSFDLFDWTGVTPTGAFAISSPYAWNLSNLYTTGEVTLTAVPEPANAALATALGVVLLRCRRHPKSTAVHAQPQELISGDNA